MVHGEEELRLDDLDEGAESGGQLGLQHARVQVALQEGQRGRVLPQQILDMRADGAGLLVRQGSQFLDILVGDDQDV